MSQELSVEELIKALNLNEDVIPKDHLKHIQFFIKSTKMRKSTKIVRWTALYAYYRKFNDKDSYMYPHYFLLVLSQFFKPFTRNRKIYFKVRALYLRRTFYEKKFQQKYQEDYKEKHEKICWIRY